MRERTYYSVMASRLGLGMWTQIKTIESSIKRISDQRQECNEENHHVLCLLLIR
jgi:hypothetical protein